MLKFLVLIWLLGLPWVAKAATVEPALLPQWLALGHYRPQFWGGYRSSIDDDNFFLAQDGRHNPSAELQATIALFAGDDEAKKCRFPARYAFLYQNGLLKADFPSCADFEQFKKDLKPSGVTLLFTDAYMNNPSSLFGHTLLRIDTARHGTQLLAHGANYGAFTEGQEGSLLFAVYGLTGGYYGGWTVKPYYDIINTYNNLENRDIWELNLNFSATELDMFVAHLWEVGQTQTPYYFFTKNCSYMIMEVLDAVRPELKLADEFPWQTIPLDTIKAVASRPDMVKNVDYRPSRQAKIINRRKQMNLAQNKVLIKLVKDGDYELTGLSEAEKADVLETAYQYVQYQFVKKQLSLTEYRQRSFKSLMARNRLTSRPTTEENPQGRSPLKAHEAMRLTLGGGRRKGESFQELAYRPAYHSLTDNDYGLLNGAEINFLNSRWRHYDASHKTLLSELNIIGIKSISPIDELFNPVSFAINWNLQRLDGLSEQHSGYISNLKVDGGGSYALTSFLWLYAMSGAEVAYGGFLPHNQFVSVELVGGIYCHWSRLKMLAEISKSVATGNLGNRTLYRGELNIPLSTNWAVASEYSFTDRDKGSDIEEFMLSLRHYF